MISNVILHHNFVDVIDGPPTGATHQAEFYGDIIYYKQVQYDHLNQVAEEWQILSKWYYWDHGMWFKVGNGFSTRRLEIYDTRTLCTT